MGTGGPTLLQAVCVVDRLRARPAGPLLDELLQCGVHLLEPGIRLLDGPLDETDEESVSRRRAIRSLPHNVITIAMLTAA